MIETVPVLRGYISIDKEKEKIIEDVGKIYPWRLTEYYASLMDSENENCPLRLQVVPDIRELENSFGEPDPLCEETNSIVPGVIRVYPDRIAVLVTSRCPVYCRFCLRKRLSRGPENDLKGDRLRNVLAYIKQDKSIRDVLLTGGEPLMLSDGELEEIIRGIRSIRHVEIIRIGTRSLCTQPDRVTEEFALMISKYHPVWINTHFNHPKEITNEAAKAADILLSKGIPVGNQSVLLKNINDKVETMRELVNRLVNLRIRPYYLYQAQTLSGTGHFVTAIEKGLEIIKGLRGWTTGFAVPQYVLDTPYGKVPLNPEYLGERKGDFIEMVTFSGKKWREFNPLVKSP